MSRASYLTIKRVAEIERQLHTRDRLVLADVDRMSILSGQQIRRLHYPATEAGRRIARMDLARLHGQQVLHRLGRRVGGERSGSDGYVWGLGLAGQRIVHPDQRRRRQPWTPQPNHLGHALAVSELYTVLRTEGSDGQLLTFDAEPACWRFFSGVGGSRLVLKPDAYVEIETDDYIDSYFIEVDRGTESGTRIAEKTKSYVRYWQAGREQERLGVFPQVLWLVPDDHRKDQLTEIMGRRSADEWTLFAIAKFDTAAPYLLPGAKGPEGQP